MYLQAFLTFLKFFAKEVQNMKNDLSKYLSKLSIVLFAANIKNNIYKTNIVDSPITIPPYSSSFNEPIVDEGINDDIIKHEAVAYRNNHIVKYGNDISHYQGEIDFKKFVAHSSFAICKLGEDFKIDPTFYSNVNNALKYNIDVGAYLYSHADNEEEARKEARFVISSLNSLSLRGKLTYPIYLDYEEKSIKNRTKEENTKIINAFCDELLSSSYYPGLYIGGNNYLNYTFQEEISCDIWIAHYFNGSSEEKLNTFFSRYPSSRVTMWQFDDGTYSSSSIKGSDLGVSSSYVDQNYAFVDYPSIIKEKGLN